MDSCLCIPLLPRMEIQEPIALVFRWIGFTRTFRIGYHSSWHRIHGMLLKKHTTRMDLRNQETSTRHGVGIKIWENPGWFLSVTRVRIPIVSIPFSKIPHLLYAPLVVVWGVQTVSLLPFQWLYLHGEAPTFPISLAHRSIVPLDFVLPQIKSSIVSPLQNVGSCTTVKVEPLYVNGIPFRYPLIPPNPWVIFIATLLRIQELSDHLTVKFSERILINLVASNLIGQLMISKIPQWFGLYW